MFAVLIALCVVVAILCVLVVGLLLSHGAILRQLHEAGAGLEPLQSSAGQGNRPATAGHEQRAVASAGHRPDHRQASDLSGLSPSGSAITVGLATARQPTLLAFLSTGCTTCAGFWDAFGSGQAGALDERGIRLVIVTRGADGESPAEVRRLAPPDITTVQSNAAWQDYDVPANPYFVLIGTGGTVAGEGAAPGWPALLNLLQRTEADGTLPTGPAIRGRDRGRGRARPSRIDRSDEHLAQVGIGPGHESLYPTDASAPSAPRD